jgi:hypothetical protein
MTGMALQLSARSPLKENEMVSGHHMGDGTPFI